MAQAVIVMPFFDPHRVILVELAAKHRLAYMSGSRDATEAGGLVSMAANFPELYDRSRKFVSLAELRRSAIGPCAWFSLEIPRGSRAPQIVDRSAIPSSADRGATIPANETSHRRLY
jgi:hypothetical protein